MPRFTEPSRLPIQEQHQISVTLEEALQILAESLLPEEIKREHGWEERLDDDENPAIIVQEIHAVTAARAGRKQTAAASSIKFFDPEIRDRFGETNLTRLLERILDERPKNIGEGKTAQVFARRLEQEGLSGYCMKMITDTDGAEYKAHNDVTAEAKIMDVLAREEVQGVRIPKPCFAIQNDRIHVLIMERLDAVSLADVFEHRQPFPPSFDYERFFTALLTLNT